MTCIYLIGSLRNPQIPEIGNSLRKKGFDVFDDWHAAGPIADDSWRDYEQARGHSYKEALEGHPAKHVFTFDEYHLNRAHIGVLVYPAGKSGHLELGYLVGQGKETFILLDEIPERYDVMTQFATGGVFTDLDSFEKHLCSLSWPKIPDIPQLYQHELMWLAGLLEGEGSFCISGNVPRLVLQMTDLDIIQHAAKLLNSSVWGGKRRTKGNKLIWACGASGLASIEYMRILKPYLGTRRNKQITDTVSMWLGKRKYNKNDNFFWTRMFQL